jgi:hypothetical protein
MFLFDKYKGSCKEVLNVPIIKMHIGGFYFIQYEDDSNWMKYSPTFVVDFRKFENILIINRINI